MLISQCVQVPPPGITPAAKPPSIRDPRSSEDCLFLDVLVPRSIYDGALSHKNPKAPVLVWIFGGGFYSGSAESQGDPAGLLAQSMSDPVSSGVVYVSINYRLGALGWLAGPSFAESGGVPNAGLHDQRQALYWVQKYIHLFGGDPERVTLMGASSGAASGLHQITAHGGASKAPFQQAFLQSPAFNPNPYPSLQEATYNYFLQTAKATSLSELRAASSESIIAANEAVIWNSTYGATRFGPVVDGTFVPQLPVLSLLEGHYSHNVENVFSGHNTDEGLIFTDPSIQNTSVFNTKMLTIFPDIQPATLSYIENTLYPPVFNNSNALGYNDTISRLATLEADLLLTCNVNALMRAFDVNKSYAYLFEEGPSLHAEETPYTFYNYGPTADAYGFGLVNGTVAKELQDWVINFSMTSNPNGARASHIPVYGSGREMGALSNKALGTPVTDPAQQERCNFWQKALYY